MFSFLQILLTISLLMLLGSWRYAQAKRKKRTWDQIVSALRPNDWGLEEVSERYLYRPAIRAVPVDIWKRIDGPRGLWAMYCNAPLLIQLADYAVEHGTSPDQELLEALRRDAFHIRLCALLALLKYATLRSTIAASTNAHRATAAYTEMLFRLTTLFEQSAGQLLPSYLAAM
jgi:hypothetical protein